MNREEQTRQICHEVIKAAQMGIDSIDELLKVTEDKNFIKELIDTQNIYKEAAHETNALLLEFEGIPRELSAGIRIETWTAVKIKTVGGASSEKLSELILKGMNMADKELSEIKKTYPEADEKAYALLQKFLRLQKAERVKYEKRACK